MTLCIGAICRKENLIVATTDLMLSADWMSLDTQTLKLVPISPTNRWLMMYSGVPTVDLAVQSYAKEIIAQGGDTMPEVVAACEQAFREELKRKIEGRVLSPYGLDRETFLRKGRRYFGETEFSRLVAEVEAISLETRFLVGGFDPNRRPYLFSVSHPGTVEHHGALGFYAIGNGSRLALGALAMTFDVDIWRYEFVYRVCEAKFAGERALGVGRKTFVLVLSPDGSQERLKPENVEPIRKIWNEVGKPPVPEDAVTTIREGLIGMTWKHSPPERRL